MASRLCLSSLICFSSAQTTQSMNARAGTMGMSSKMKSESNMTNALRWRIQKARQEAAVRASERKTLFPYWRSPHVKMEQSTCNDFLRGEERQCAGGGVLPLLTLVAASHILFDRSDRVPL